MSKRADFLQLVQTACIVQDVNASFMQRSAQRNSVEVLAHAQRIDESLIPEDDLAKAALDFVVYAYGASEGPPAWYVEWLEQAGADW